MTMSEEFRKGALAEVAAIHDGMTEDGKDIYEYVKIVAQRGKDSATIAAEVAYIFMAGQPLRKRLALAWKLVRH